MKYLTRFNPLMKKLIVSHALYYYKRVIGAQFLRNSIDLLLRAMECSHWDNDTFDMT